ncbi:MAG: N-acetyl-1-D-myo-inositol-2-amino-2-deoxy-alpha-D-glucopyranoside deacetylase [Nocardiaceae bacterium]|nr:N-acetyl-1-D-myo-inositol-2-amino-2-deoxy-alpha-D-glucopyranoside deacetylase [Nocardiaceae bacterium]
MSKKLLFVHAHPDDESILTGGTIALHTSRGDEVLVVTCTLGEEGEVIGSTWAGLVAGVADQLGGYRIAELSKALAALGVSEPRFLGGAGRWRDSGMAGTPSAEHPRAFINAYRPEVVSELVRVINEFRPDVVVGYDPEGGYGHPDHIQVHAVTTAAVEAATWRTSRFYWAVASRDAVEAGVAAMGELPDGWNRPRPGELAAMDSSRVTTEIDITPVLDAKRAALAAHATQVMVADGLFALSNNVAQPLLASEFFVLVSGDADGLVSEL